MDLKESDILGETIELHWYYRCKAAAMLKLVGCVKGKSILDIGAGSGYFSKYLLNVSDARDAWCVDTCYENDADKTELGKPIRFRREVSSSLSEVVLLMDVLEHVEDDVGLLAQYVEITPKGSRFLISVPAFQYLWSGHDVFLGHKRRYTLNEIEEVARSAGLRVIKGAYFFAGIFPIAVAFRLVKALRNKADSSVQSDLRKHHTFTNAILNIISMIELRFITYNRIGGLTAFCIAEK